MTDREDRAASLDTLNREVLDWVVRLTSGEATQADADALARWRGQSPAHAEAFADAVRLRHMLRHAARELAAESAQSRQPGRFLQLRQHPAAARFIVGRRALVGGALAASAAYMMLRPPLGLWPSLAELAADYRTGTGEQRQITLADGVSVAMNTQTSLAVRSNRKGPQIELISGEAEFVAGLDPATPFVAVAADGRTIAARAKFNLRHDGPAVCVTCLDGTLQVEQRGRAVSLQARQQVSYDDQGLGAAVSVDPALVSAWRAGLLVFHDEPLSAVITEVNRYRPGKIIVTSAALGRRPVNAVIHLDRIDGIIGQVRKLGAHVTSLPGGVVLLG